MTLYELLHKVSFDEIAPFLSKSYTEGKPLAETPILQPIRCRKTRLSKTASL